MKKIFVFLGITLLLCSVLCFAHSGRTDSNGGHVDSSTGEYHYHHGYSAHSHYDMDGDGIADCPYTKSSTSSYSNHSDSGSIDIESGDIVMIVLILLFAPIAGYVLSNIILALFSKVVPEDGYLKGLKILFPIISIIVAIVCIWSYFSNR